MNNIHIQQKPLYTRSDRYNNVQTTRNGVVVNTCMLFSWRVGLFLRARVAIMAMTEKTR